MFTIICGRVRAYSSNGASPCHASSQTDRPSSRRSQANRAGRGSRHEIALLVEHAEVRQLDLVVARLHLTVSDEGGRVVQASLRTVHEPDHHRARRARRSRRRARRARPGCPRRTAVEGPGPRADSPVIASSGKQMRSASCSAARAVHSAMRATLPSRSPTVVFSWPSATRTTIGSLRDPTLRTRGAERYSVPPMSTLYASHTRSAPFCRWRTTAPIRRWRSFACLVGRPGVALDLSRLQSLDERRDRFRRSWGARPAAVSRCRPGEEPAP